jgi:hypothetical protein
MADLWLRCTECKSEIAFGARYYKCSVSTCNRSKLRLVFCSVICWDSHLADARHRDAWAEDARAPTREAWQHELAAAAPPPVTPAPHGPAPTAAPRPAAGPAGSAALASPSAPAPSGAPGPVRRVVGDASPATAAAVEGVQLMEVADREILIVVSKLKKYIKDRSGMNCSDAVADLLSDHVRVLCDDAIRAAARDERKTVLDRDVARVRR